MSYAVSLYHALIGQNMVELLPCFYMQIYAVPAWTMSCALMFLIGFDRLLAVLFPLWYVEGHRSKLEVLLFESDDVEGEGSLAGRESEEFQNYPKIGLRTLQSRSKTPFQHA